MVLLLLAAQRMRSPCSRRWQTASARLMSRLHWIRESYRVACHNCKLIHRTHSALHQLSLYDAKSEPDLSPIRVIRLADMIMHLWQRYIATALVPLAGTSVTVRREMGIFNNHVTVRIEDKVNSIVQRSTDGECLRVTVASRRRRC